MHVRGVTYGTFRPDERDERLPERRRRSPRTSPAWPRTASTPSAPTPCRRAGCSTWRSEHGLHVMVGLPWEQHVTFLDDRRRTARRSSERVREVVRSCAGHPAVLCYAIGNEIPASIVRWHGRRRIERFLERLYHAAKERGPGRARHLRQLPEHRVPPAAVRRPRLLQRLPRVGPAVRGLPRPAAEHRRRPAAGPDRGRPRLAAQRRGGAGAGARLAGPHRVRRAAAPACSCSPGPTSGTAAASTIDDWAFGLVDRDREPEAGAGHGRQGLRRGAVPPGPRLAARLGGGLRVQQRGHAAQLLRRPARRSTTRTTR